MELSVLSILSCSRLLIIRLARPRATYPMLVNINFMFVDLFLFCALFFVDFELNCIKHYKVISSILIGVCGKSLRSRFTLESRQRGVSWHLAGFY